MPLADLVPVAMSTRIARRRLTPTQMQMRWLNKPGNRDKFNAYRREWRRRQRS